MKFDMDYIAHHNRLTLMNSYYKIAIAMGLMIITLFLNILYFDVIIFALMLILIVAVAGISFKSYLKFISIPAVFTILTCVFLLFFFGTGNIVWDSHFYGIAIRQDAVDLAIYTFFRIFACFSCLGFLGLTTPIAEVLHSLEVIKVPKIVIEIALLMYNTIFIFLNEIDIMKKAQETRLGYNGYKTSFKSVAMLGSNIFLRSMDKAESLQHSLDSRGYDGEIPMYKPQNRSDD